MSLRRQDDGSKFCVECGQRLAISAQFCELCGATAQRACRACGHLNASDARFCGACGGGLTAQASDAAPARAPKPTHRTSAGQSHLAERKLVTIMFVDMIDSLAAIRDVDPEEAHQLFSGAVSVMTAAIHGYGGTVIGNTGDGVLAVFGAPTAQEDHAERSCHAALSVIERLKEARRRQRILDVRIGLHSGEVAVGTSTNDFSIDYEATGAPVHIAARLQNSAPPGRAVMSAATRALLRGAFVTEPLGPTRVKGLDRPMELFVLKGPAGAGAADAAGPREPFVGRTAELDRLRSSLDSALSGKGRVVLISGEAGIGKTALIRRFVSRATASCRVVRGTVDRYRGAVPFNPFRTLLLDLLGLTQAEAAERAAAVAARTSPAEPDADYLQWALLELFETGTSVPDWQALDPRARNQLITRAILRELARESERQPLVLVVEDLQRADSCSVELLGKLIEEVAERSILVLLSCRPEFQPGWPTAESFRQMRLGQLSRPETEDLTRRLIGTAMTASLQSRLMAWSRGNPLFLRETIRMLIDSETLDDPAAAPALAGEPTALSSPASVRAIIAERVDRLPAEAKEVLLAASVLGEEFTAALLAEVAGKPQEEVLAELDSLGYFEFVRQDPGRSEPTFQFCHPLFQEVCYGTLLRQRRARLHAAAFAAVDASLGAGAGAAVSPVEALAYHAHNGQLWGEAFAYCRAAGQRAASRSAPREAAGHLRKALTALERTDPEKRRLADAIDIRLELRTALVQLLELTAAEALVREAHALATELGEGRRLAQVVGLMAVHDYLQRGPASAVELSRQSISIAATLDDESLLIAPNICLAQACYGLGRYRDTIAILERLLPLVSRGAPAAPSGLPGRPLIMIWYWIAISKAELGRFDEAERLAERMLEQAEPLQVFDAVYAGTALGFVQMTRGESRAALKASARALEIAERSDLPYLTPVLASQVGLLLAREGETAEALRLGRRAVETASRIGVFAGRSRWFARLAEVCVLAGEPEEARAHLETAIAVAENAGELGYLCTALALRARHATAVGADAARLDLARALGIARQLAIAPTFAKCVFELAALERRAGRRDSARRKYRAALGRFQACDMPAWAQRARQELAALERALEVQRL